MQPEQLSLLPGAVAPDRRPADVVLGPEGLPLADELPVARVLVDLPLAHLDRPFDYVVPGTMTDQVRPGSRVKVRFAGQDVDGFVLDRVGRSDHDGRLSALRRAVSAEPVLHPEIARLSGLLAQRYAGTRSDVLRLAVPPRHARVEKAESDPTPPAPLDATAATTAATTAAAWWERYPGAAEVSAGLAAGATPRAVWTALPGERWAEGLAHAVSATVAGGRGAVVCVPDTRDLARLTPVLEQVLGAGRFVTLTADAGPAARYRAFLAVSRGHVRVAVGTRAAAFAPVHALGLVAMWDDGDDLYAEPRAPYCHTREVLLTRAQDAGAAVLLGATARSVEAQVLVETGWATEVVAPRDSVRAHAPRVAVTGATDVELERDPFARSARLPASAHRAVAQALEKGPVLVQTPRTGYAATLVCATCRTPARCRACSGPLHQSAASHPASCRWCGIESPEHHCQACGGTGLRAPVLGDRRTAEELGRAFPGAVVRRSSGERVLDTVPATPAIVVATPGAEPVAVGGYSAVVLMDAWLMLARPDLRTEEESLRRWLNAATLAKPQGEGGQVVLVGDPALPVVQALVRWDPAGFAAREVADRRGAHLPPASRMAALSGAETDVEAAVATLVLPPGAEVLGPVPHDGETVRVILRVPRRFGADLSRTLREMSGVRSARKLPAVRVQVDPYTLD